MTVAMGRRGAALLLALLPLAPAGLSRGGEDEALRLHGLALNLTGVGGGMSGDVVIVIERWSAEEERRQLQGAAAKEGVAGLTRVLTGPSLQRVGYVRADRGGFLELKYARQTSEPEGGRRILLATDRVSAPSNRPKADAYDFLVVDIRLDKDGKGEGRTAGPERLRYDQKEGALTVDRSGAEPVWIRELSVVPPKSPGGEETR